MDLKFDPFPILESERLIFRKVTQDDAPEILELRGDPVLMRYIPRPLAKNLEEARAYISMLEDNLSEGQHVNWGIVPKWHGKLVGTAGLFRIQPHNFRCEIGYMLLGDFHGMGLATEAVDTLLTYAFQNLGFHSVEAVIDPENTASEQVLVKSGFVREGFIKENCYWDGKFLDSAVYSILKRNHKAGQIQ